MATAQGVLGALLRCLREKKHSFFPGNKTEAGLPLQACTPLPHPPRDLPLLYGRQFKDVSRPCPNWMSTPDPSTQIRGRSGGRRDGRGPGRDSDLSTCSLNSQRALTVYKALGAVDTRDDQRNHPTPMDPEKSRSQL